METTNELYKRIEALLAKASEAIDNEELKEANTIAKEVFGLYEEAEKPEDCNGLAGFAQYIMGRYWSEEEYNNTMAWTYYLEAIELGCLAAYTELGQLFYDGDGVTPDGEPDVNQAIAYWQMGMEKGVEECTKLYEAHKHEYLTEEQDAAETDLPEEKNPCTKLMGIDVTLEKYEGHREHGLRSGFGRATFAANGYFSISYRGNWHDDLPDGEGHLEVFGNTINSWYKGTWKAGRRHGQGKFYEHWDKGTLPTYTYEGGWVDDKEEGEGSASWASPYPYSKPSTYEGQWKAGKKHGHGKMTYVNDNTVEGEWQSGSQHGPGVYTTKSGLAFSAIWNNGVLDAATIKGENGERFLSLKLYKSGFDYNNDAIVLVKVQEGQVLFGNCLPLNGEKAFSPDTLILTINSIAPDGTINFTVPGLFTRDSKPLDNSIGPGESREYKNVHKCTATIYGEDYDYETESSMAVTYA